MKAIEAGVTSLGQSTALAAGSKAAFSSQPSIHQDDTAAGVRHAKVIQLTSYKLFSAT